MKKIFSLVVAALLCATTQAQIVSSRSVSIQSEPSETVWLVRAGMNFMNMSGDGADGLDGNIGYNVSFEFNKPLGDAGGYWGMNLGVNTRGFDAAGVKGIAHNAQYSPFLFGWKIGLSENLRLDPHVGVYASYDFTSKLEDADWDDLADAMSADYNKYDIGMNVGIGLWYNRFNLDFTFQRGFVDVFTDIDGCKTSNFQIRLGVAF